MKKLLLAGGAITLAISLILPMPAAAQSESADFQQGLSDRTTWENWLKAVPSDRPDLRAGAEYWASHRGRADYASCYSFGDEKQKGCLLAQEYLNPTDARRKSNPAYRAGWNAYNPAETNASAPVSFTPPTPPQYAIPAYAPGQTTGSIRPPAPTGPAAPAPPPTVTQLSPTPAVTAPATAAAAGFVELGASGGTYTIPVVVNGHRAKFTLDSGAAVVQIPANRILQMINEGTMQASDFIRNDVFVDANGNRVSQPVYILRSLTVGGVTVNNVECVGGDDPHTFLLGQSFLSKLPSWSIDNKTGRFVIGG
jgi:hypothetical protein